MHLRLQLQDLANEKAGWPVKLEFQKTINGIFQMSMSHDIFGTHSFFFKLVTAYLECKCDWMFCSSPASLPAMLPLCLGTPEGFCRHRGKTLPLRPHTPACTCVLPASWPLLPAPPAPARLRARASASPAPTRLRARACSLPPAPLPPCVHVRAPCPPGRSSLPLPVPSTTWGHPRTPDAWGTGSVLAFCCRRPKRGRASTACATGLALLPLPATSAGALRPPTSGAGPVRKARATVVLTAHPQPASPA